MDPAHTPQTATAAAPMARPAMPKPSVFGSGGGTTTVDLTEPAPARFRSPRRLAASIVRVVWGGRLSTLLLWCSFVTSLTGSPCSAKHAAHFLALRGMPFGPFILRYSFGDAPDPGQKPNANRFMAHIGHVCEVSVPSAAKRTWVQAVIGVAFLSLHLAQAARGAGGRAPGEHRSANLLMEVEAFSHSRGLGAPPELEPTGSRIQRPAHKIPAGR